MTIARGIGGANFKLGHYPGLARFKNLKELAYH
jgi:hypothetical protein